jgi:hypothetical protein
MKRTQKPTRSWNWSMLKDESYPKGPTPPITNVGEAVKFLKRLRDSSQRYFACTAQMLGETIVVVRQLQQRNHLLEKANQRLEAAVERLISERNDQAD